jgi:hypothetical protein
LSCRIEGQFTRRNLRSSPVIVYTAFHVQLPPEFDTKLYCRLRQHQIAYIDFLVRFLVIPIVILVELT